MVRSRPSVQAELDLHDTTDKMYAHHMPLRQSEGVRGGGERREGMKRGRGMKVRVDKSRGMETSIAEALAEIKPTGPLRLAKQAVRRKRN